MGTNHNYYLIKELKKTSHNPIEVLMIEHVFRGDTTYINKIQARLFWNSKILEIERILQSTITKQQQLIMLEFYLIKVSECIEEPFFLFNSNGVENIENKKLESSLLVSTKSYHKNTILEDVNEIYTKNSFLEGNYKD